MSVIPVVDDRPGGLDSYFYPGNAIDRVIVWPEGYLTDRTWRATLDNVEMAVSTLGNVMTVSGSSALSTALGVGAHIFLLVETTGGIQHVVMVGNWEGSTSPQAQDLLSATVSLVSGSVVVTVPGTSGFSDLTVTDDLEVGGHVHAQTLDIEGLATFRSLPLASYQRLTFLAKQMDPLADAAPGYGNPTTAIPYGGWDFPANLDRGIMIPWAPPRVGLDGTADIFWTSFNIALIWINMGATGGNIRWKTRARNLGIFIDPVTKAPFVDNTVSIAAAGQHIISAGQSALAVPIVPAFFGSEYSLEIWRMGAEGADTCEQTIRLGMFSYNQAA